MKCADGTLTELEVRRFPKPLNPGHRPFAGRDDRIMTNVTASATVQSASGCEFTMCYESGSQKIIVPENAAASTLVAGDRSQLVAGASVNLSAPGGDGKPVAIRARVTAQK
jgi:hypothetical protein